MEHSDARWPLVALELARDEIFLERISFFQQAALVGNFGRLRRFDEAVYNNIAELLLLDFSLFKQPIIWHLCCGPMQMPTVITRSSSIVPMTSW